MTDKQMRRLSRSEGLELLLEQTQEVERLQAMYQRAVEQLENRRLVMDEAGSIAEASLRLNQVFESAQQAADQYLYNARQKEAACEKLEAQTREACADMRKQAEAEVKALWQDTCQTLMKMAGQKPELREYLMSVIPGEYL